MPKSFIDDWEAPHFREKQKFPWGTVVGVVIAIILIVFIILSFTNQQPSQDVVGQQTETIISNEPIPATEIVVEKSPVVTSVAPEMKNNCDVVAGIVPGSIVTNGAVVSVTFKNNGKQPIAGSYFEFSFEDKKAYRKNSDSLTPGQTITYEVDLEEIDLEVGSRVRSFIILPIQEDKACFNQKMIVFSERGYEISTIPNSA